MATLMPTHDVVQHPIAASSLHAWLQGNWALLFSHPDDFACNDFEADRWLVVLQQTFAAAGVQPLALASHMSAPFNSWVTDAGGAAAVLFDNGRPSQDVVDLNACALHDAISRAVSRFVMIIDDSLRIRRTFVYTAQNPLPSPLDFAATAYKLRTSSTAPREPVDTVYKCRSCRQSRDSDPLRHCCDTDHRHLSRQSRQSAA